MRRVTTKDGVGVAYVSAGGPQSSDSTQRAHSQLVRLAKKVSSLPKVPRAPVPVATGSKDVVDVDMNWQKLAASVCVRRGTTNVDGLYQPVLNQPVSVEKYLEEAWHDSKRFAALPYSGTLLSVTKVRGYNVMLREGLARSVGTCRPSVLF